MPMRLSRFESFLRHSFRHQNILYYFLFFACVVLLYGRAVFFDITYFVDVSWTRNNFDDLIPGSHWWRFFLVPDLLNEYYYRPLLNLSFLWDARLGHGAVWAYHLTNLVLHALCGCFLFRLLEEWGFARGRALAGTLIFLVHPVLVEAVVWIPGRTDSLLGLFCFSGFFFFLRWQRLGRARDLAAYALCLAGALLSKETAVVLAFIVSVMSLWPQNGSESRAQRFRVFAVSACVTSVWFLVRAAALAGTTGGSFGDQLRLLIDNLPVIWLYLGKAYFPLNVSVLPLLEKANLNYGFFTFMFLAGCFLLSRTKDSIRIFWAALWFVLFLLPSLVIGDFKYEYRIYVSMLGAVIAGLELFPGNFSRTFSALSAAAVIGFFSGLTWNYSGDYKDQESFWISAVESQPQSPLARRNLGVMFHAKGNLDSAYKYYMQALAINPKEEFVNGNIGLLYLKLGNIAVAEDYFKKEIRLYPWNYLPYFNLAQIRGYQKRPDEAERLLTAAMMLNPFDADVYSALIRIHLFRGRTDLAGEVFRRMPSGMALPPDILEKAKEFNGI